MIQKEERPIPTQEWLESIYIEHYDRIYLTILAKTGYKRELSEDLTHDVFKTFLEKPQDAIASGNVAGWLMETAKNKTKAELRKARYHREGYLPEEEWFLFAAPEDETAFFEWLPIELPEGDKRFLFLRIYCGYSFKDVGAEYGCASTAAQMRCRRILDKCRELLEGKS